MSVSAVRLTNLCAVALGSIFILWSLLGLLRSTATGLEPGVGGDYLVFLASAEIADTDGFAAVYDLDKQDAVQLRRLGKPPNSDSRVTATFFLPVFVAPFELMLLPPAVVSFWIWVAITIAVTLLVLRSWESGSPNSREPGVIPSLLLSFPFLAMLSLGQVDVILLVCMSGFLRAGMGRADVRAGLWLSGLLLKPQTLIVIVPGLIVARRWRCLAGLGAGAAFLVATSVALGGVGALWTEAGLILRTIQGPDSARIIAAAGNRPRVMVLDTPELMTNWRALGMHLSGVLGAPATELLVIVASVITLIAALGLWLRSGSQTGVGLAATTMGSYAAACSISVHANSSMSVPLLVPLLFLTRERLLPWHILTSWTLVPLALTAASIFVAAFEPPIPWPSVDNLGVLLVNLVLLAWAVRLEAPGFTRGAAATPA